jgi:23S rRNA pseudouridine1911/1915/1917 synthase
MEEFEQEITESEELYEHFRIVADKGQQLLRIDKFLMNRMENVSRNRIQNAARAGSILVNGNSVKPNYKVRPNDEISIVLPHPPRDKELYPENIPLDIVYEDEFLLVVNKPAGMVVHPGYNNYTGTLVNALVYHFSQLPSKPGNEMRPGLVHRIDKDTTGLLVIAKDDYAMTHLAKQFFDHSIERKYLALVWGGFNEDSGTITGNLDRSLQDRRVMQVFEDPALGKHAITHWRVIERFGYTTLIECQLETGRTHQIRAHMRYIKRPLFNDETYGGNRILFGTPTGKYKQFIENSFKILPRQALHAASLGFIHPETKKQMKFEAPLPEDMAQVVEKWRNYTKFKPLEED